MISREVYFEYFRGSTWFIIQSKGKMSNTRNNKIMLYDVIYCLFGRK